MPASKPGFTIGIFHFFGRGGFLGGVVGVRGEEADNPRPGEGQGFSVALEGVFLQLADCHGGKGAPRTLVGVLTWRKTVGAPEEEEGRQEEITAVSSFTHRARLKLPALRTLSDQPLGNNIPPTLQHQVTWSLFTPCSVYGKEPTMDSPAEPEIKCLASSLRKSSHLSPSVCITEMTVSVFISAFASSTENNTLHSYSKG